MAAEDWKGVAMILQQLGEMAKPSQLDVVEKEYELKSLEKQADREHEFMLQNYKSMQEKYEDQKNTYDDLMEKGNALHAELNDMKEIDYSGNADKVMDSIYGGKYNNYEAGLKMQGEFINQLQNEIVLAQKVNKAGTLGKDFTSQWSATGNDGKQINYAKDFDVDGVAGLSFDEKIAAIDAESTRRYGDGDEAENTRNAFTLVARAQLDAEKEKTEDSKAVKTSTDLQDARDSIPNLVNDLKSIDAFTDSQGDIDFVLINQTPSMKQNPTYKLYEKNMAILAAAGEAHLYRPKVMNESSFPTITNSRKINTLNPETNQYSTYDIKDENNNVIKQVDINNYSYEDYILVSSGLNAAGQAVPLNMYKTIKEEFEWLRSTRNKSDNQETINPFYIEGDEDSRRYITVGERRRAFAQAMEDFYGKGN